MITSKDIRDKAFERNKMGYRAADVDQFLETAAASMRSLEEQNSELVEKIQILAAKVEEYREDEDALRLALLSAQKLGEQTIRDAKAKANLILEDAEIKAEKVVEGAKFRAEKEEIALKKIKKEVADFKSKLLMMYKAHLEVISALPEAEEPAKAESAPEAETHPEADAPQDAGTDMAEPVENVDGEGFSIEAETPPQEETPISAEQITLTFEPQRGLEVVDEEPAPTAASAQGGESRFKLEDFPEEDKEEKFRPISTRQHREPRFGSLEFGPGYSLSDDRSKRRK